MAGDAEVFAKEHVGPVVAALGFSRRERAFVRIAPSGTVAVVVGVVGSRFNVPRAYSDALGVPNQVEVTIQLYAGVAIPPSPKKMLTAFPQAVGQTPAAACAYGWKRSYRVRDDGLTPSSMPTAARCCPARVGRASAPSCCRRSNAPISPR